MIPLQRVISGRLFAVAFVFCVAGCNCETTLRNWINQTSEESRTQLEPEGDAGEENKIDDQEPNDSRDEANNVELTGSLDPIRGTVAKPGDLDWYKITTKQDASWVVDFEISPATEESSLDPYAELTPGATSKQTYRYERTKDDNPLSVQRIEIGNSPLFLGVGGRSGTTGRYRVKIRKRLSASAVEREPNDTPERATTMSYPGEVQGFFDRAGDVDLYKIPKQKKAAAIHRFQLAPTHAQPYRVEMYKGAPDGKPFAAFDVPKDDRRAIPNLGIPVGQADIWLRVTPREPAKDDETADKQTDAGSSTLPDPSASYRIRIIRHPPSKSFKIEGEPNDSPGSGFRVELGTPLRGYLSSSKDRDVVRVAVGDPPEPSDAGPGASPDAGPDGPTDAKSAAEKPSKAKKPDASTAADAESQVADPYAALPDKTPPAHLIQVGVETLRENRPVAIELLGFPNDETKYASAKTDESGRATVCNVAIEEGFVEVAVSRPPGVKSTGLSRGYDYQLFSVDVLQNLDGVEIEPNDTRARADRIRENRTGFLTSSADRDVYAFRVGEPPNTESKTNKSGNKSGAKSPDAGSKSSSMEAALSSVTIKLKVRKRDLRFTVADSAGAPIARVDRAGPASDEKTQLDLPNGVYFLTVASRRGGSCAPYTISVETN